MMGCNENCFINTPTLGTRLNRSAVGDMARRDKPFTLFE
jgi:hypothetical protein